MRNNESLLHRPADAGQPVVAADLEGTLTAGTTWHALRDYLRAHGAERAYRNFFLRHLPGIVRFKLGWGDGQSFKVAWIREIWALFEGYRASEIEMLAAWVVERELWPARRQPVLAELYAYADQGYRVILLSGVAEPVLAAFAGRAAAEQGPAFEAIGTPLAWETVAGEEATFTGRFRSELNIGRRKVDALQSFARAGKIEAAYGDTAPDIGMLAMSRRPVAVAPDPGLRQAAVERGWRIIAAD